jgi:acyl carrier protein
MGLDSIEIILEIEDEFDLAIPDEDAEGLRTVGEIIDYVEHRLRERGDVVPAGKRDVPERVVRIVAESLRIDPLEIRRDSRLAEDLGAD